MKIWPRPIDPAVVEVKCSGSGFRRDGCGQMFFRLTARYNSDPSRVLLYTAKCLDVIVQQTYLGRDRGSGGIGSELPFLANVHTSKVELYEENVPPRSHATQRVSHFL